jgi:cobalt-zinc-cadmium resistance protein CzcA
MQIPLHQLAEVKVQNGPNQIQREDAKRRIVVGFNIAGRDVQTIVNELQAKVNQSLKLPAGYYLTYGGSFENLNAAKQRLTIAVPISLILIFILLFFAFHSVKDGLLIYSAIPLSAIGGIFFLALRGMPFSISAGIGFIALFGVAVLNGIVLVAEFNRIRKDGETDIHKAIMEGTQHRLRPVLMTAFVASLGFLPMAFSNGAGAEVQRPLATVVIGGLLVATLLTLFVLPVLYLFFENGIGFRLRKPSLAVVIPFVLCSIPALAQQKINLKTAIELAIANNQTLKSEKLRVDYQKALLKTSRFIPSTSFTAEAGQIPGSMSPNHSACQ